VLYHTIKLVITVKLAKPIPKWLFKARSRW